MKPKDLLEHLEKGDRTLYHLTKKPEIDSLTMRVSELSGMFAQVYGQPLIDQMRNRTWTGTSAGIQAAQSTGLIAQNQGIGMQNQMNTGGIIRW